MATRTGIIVATAILTLSGTALAQSNSVVSTPAGNPGGAMQGNPSGSPPQNPTTPPINPAQPDIPVGAYQGDSARSTAPGTPPPVSGGASPTQDNSLRRSTVQGPRPISPPSPQ